MIRFQASIIIFVQLAFAFRFLQIWEFQTLSLSPRSLCLKLQLRVEIQWEEMDSSQINVTSHIFLRFLFMFGVINSQFSFVWKLLRHKFQLRLKSLVSQLSSSHASGWISLMEKYTETGPSFVKYLNSYLFFRSIQVSSHVNLSMCDMHDDSSNFTPYTILAKHDS